MEQMRVADANKIKPHKIYSPITLQQNNSRRLLFGGGGIVNPEFNNTKSEYAFPSSENLKALYALNFSSNLSNINFTANRINKKSFPLTKYHDKISCPCCGEKMVNFDWKEAEVFAKSISIKKGDELAETLYTNIHEFQYSKRKLVEKLAGAAPKFPEKNISELLSEISKEYIDKLRKKQKNIVCQMADELKNKAHSHRAAIIDWQNFQIDRITNAEDEGDFKNSRLIKSFISLAEKYNVNLTGRKINTYNDRLPNSKRDIEAFVIKYQRRKPYETAYELIKNTTPTIEHIVPFSKSENNSYGNLLLMCSDCNSARGNTKYNEFLNLFPEMKYNINKYFKDIEKLVQNNRNDLKLKNMYKSYIRDAKNTLMHYTDGRLNTESVKKSPKKRTGNKRIH